MAKTKEKTNGKGNGSPNRLDEAITLLVNTQAAMMARVVETDRLRAETDRELARLEKLNQERFARIEAILMEHSRILAEHGEILERLPDAVRERMGFRGPGTT